MISVGKNKELFEYFKRPGTWILDSLILKVDIQKDGFWQVVEITFELVKSQKIFMLRFTEVQSYKFQYKAYGSNDYVVWCKFFLKDDSVYISLKTPDEDDIIDENDNFCVHAKDVEGFI